MKHWGRTPSSECVVDGKCIQGTYPKEFLKELIFLGSSAPEWFWISLVRSLKSHSGKNTKPFYFDTSCVSFGVASIMEKAQQCGMQQGGRCFMALCLLDLCCGESVVVRNGVILSADMHSCF